MCQSISLPAVTGVTSVLIMSSQWRREENNQKTPPSPGTAWECLISGITGDWVTEWYYRLPSLTLPQSRQPQVSPRCWELLVLLTSIRNVDVSEGCFLTFLTNQSHPIFKSDITLAWHDLNWLNKLPNIQLSWHAVATYLGRRNELKIRDDTLPSSLWTPNISVLLLQMIGLK